MLPGIQRCRSTVSGSRSMPAAARQLMTRWFWWSPLATAGWGLVGVCARIMAVWAVSPTCCLSSVLVAPVDDHALSTCLIHHCTTPSRVPRNWCLTWRPATPASQVRFISNCFAVFSCFTTSRVRPSLLTRLHCRLLFTALDGYCRRRRRIFHRLSGPVYGLGLKCTKFNFRWRCVPGPSAPDWEQ